MEQGFELAVSQPEVIFKMINGKKYEPVGALPDRRILTLRRWHVYRFAEEVILDINQEYMGLVMERMSTRCITRASELEKPKKKRCMGLTVR